MVPPLPLLSMFAAKRRKKPCKVRCSPLILTTLVATVSTMAFSMSAMTIAMPSVGVRTSVRARTSRAVAPMTLSGSMSSSVSLASEGELRDGKIMPNSERDAHRATPGGVGGDVGCDGCVIYVDGTVAEGGRGAVLVVTRRVRPQHLSGKIAFRKGGFLAQ